MVFSPTKAFLPYILHPQLIAVEHPTIYLLKANRVESLYFFFHPVLFLISPNFSCFIGSQKASLSINSPLALSGGAPNAMCARSRYIWLLNTLSSSLSFYFSFLLSPSLSLVSSAILILSPLFSSCCPFSSFYPHFQLVWL